jgi:D-glycero-D-manno-heptose 1,7-bisphosphate phosphatase
MKRPAIFFDRDNTLIVCDGYLGDPAQVALVPGAADAVARARQLGYAVVVFSNQSGVARGLFAEEDVHAVNARLEEMIKDANPDAVIDRHEFCPFHPEATLEEYRKDSDLRKPRPGMIHAAAERLGLELSRSWVIGDAPRDIEAGHAAGCRTILFADPSLPESPAARAELNGQPEYRAASLKEALDHIESNAEPVHQRVAVKPIPRDPPTDASSRNHAPDPVRVERAAPVSAESDDDVTDDDDAQALAGSLMRLERLAEQILHELRRRRDEPNTDFSVPRLLAGVIQVITLAVLFMSYLNRGTSSFQPMLLLALFFQTFTIALLIMGRMR